MRACVCGVCVCASVYMRVCAWILTRYPLDDIPLQSYTNKIS